MTAGSGIIHQEMPQGDERGAMYGFQLWANLPAANKMMKPRYRGVTSAEIPSVTDPSGATIKVIAGTVGGVTGPVRDVVTSPEYLDVNLPAGTSFTHPTPRGHTVFAYVIGGQGVFCQQQDPYSYEAVGGNYFDMTRERLIGDGHLVCLRRRRPGLRRGRDGRRAVPAHLGKADRRAHRLVRSHRDEHAGRAASRLQRDRARNVHQGSRQRWVAGVVERDFLLSRRPPGVACSLNECASPRQSLWTEPLPFRDCQPLRLALLSPLPELA